MTFPWLLLVVIGIGTGVGIISLYLYKKKLQAVKYLQNEYKTVYMQLTSKIGASCLSIIEQKDVSIDIAAMLFDAQVNNKPIESVIGADQAKFVDSITHSLGFVKQWPLLIAEGIQYMILSLFIVHFAVHFMRPTNTLYEATIGYPLIMYLLLLSFVILPMIKYYIRKKKTFSIVIPSLLIVLCISLFIFNGRLFGPESVFTSFFDAEISLIPNAIVFIVLLLLFLLIFFARYIYRKYIAKKMSGM